jgi:hypothetical protein
LYCIGAEYAEQTKDGRQQAIKVYDMCSLVKPLMPKFKDITIMQMNDNSFPMIITEWANWMMEQRKPLKKDGTDKVTFKWAVGTMLNYIGQFCIMVGEKDSSIKEHPLMKERSSDSRSDAWLSSLYYQVKMRCHAWAVKNSVHVSSGSTPVRRKVVKRMYHYLFSLNTAKGFKDRFILNTNRSSVGRGGEHANSSWNFMQWNEQECNIFGEKRESKTGRDTTIPFVASSNFLECHSHAMACWLMTNEPYSNTSNTVDVMDLQCDFLFPEFYNSRPGTAARQVTTIVRSCFKNGEVEGMTSDMTSTSLRCGAVDDMMLNQHLDVVDTICRCVLIFSHEIIILFHQIQTNLH